MSWQIPLSNSIGVMQGRLSPQTCRGYQAFPMETWAQEFHIAADLGFDHIEWVIDHHFVEDNPLLQEPEEIAVLAASTGVAVPSVCADIFMEFPLDSTITRAFELFEAIAHGMRIAGARILVIPCVDQSSLLSPASQWRLRSALPTILEIAAREGICVALEADLPPREFRELLDEFPSQHLGVNYDSGNSASLSYDWEQERSAYGTRIALVHVKDRLAGGPSVPLGTGEADLIALFRWLQSDFRGPITMQAYRDRQGLGVLQTQMDWLTAQFGDRRD